MSSKDGEEPIILGKTETITKSSNPTWTYAFKIDFTVGKLYYINVGVHDDSSKQKYKNKPLGSSIFEIGDILGTIGNVKGKSIKGRGVIYVRVMPVMDDHFSAPDLVLELKGFSLKNTQGLFRKSDPFYELQRRDFAPGGGYSWYTVCRSEHVDNELDPVWKPTAVNIVRLCDNDHSIPFRICVFDWSKKGNYTDMGMIETNLEVLLNAKSPNRFTLKNQKGKECGVLAVTRADMGGVLSNAAILPGAEYRSLDPPPVQSQNISDSYMPSAPLVVPPISVPSTSRPTFVDYVSSGCELSMCVAIDFTGSNGDPLKNTEGVFRKSDPFYELQRRDFAPGGGYNWYTVCRSEHVNNELDPVWKPTAVNVNQLCDNDHSILFRICVFDWSKNGNYTDMGMIETNLEVLLNAKSSNRFTLKDKKGQECGVLAVTRAEMEGALSNSAIPAGTEDRSLDP
eukprot:CAMPEP_0194442640 /NCGR_PEP_ID=MMETSP0176-20130528/126249_1 /TAXON_ID=216777 /ORGANISM="Proboscia alata, Strain PI-D3" /LENGTH=453 /DNA_ID=CAMNT_0039268773 /DNA_START=394 /DNA_END=1751 /DNA_ORIENTATION=-